MLKLDLIYVIIGIGVVGSMANSIYRRREPMAAVAHAFEWGLGALLLAFPLALAIIALAQVGENNAAAALFGFAAIAGPVFYIWFYFHHFPEKARRIWGDRHGR